MRKFLPMLYIRWTILATALVLTAGCDGGSNGIGPENQLEVTNAIDQFQFQLTALENVSDRRSYDWENTGTQATIDVSQALTGGSAILTISDAEGSVLYEAQIDAATDETTTLGIAGMWRIEVKLSDATGTFNFRVQKTS